MLSCLGGVPPRVKDKVTEGVVTYDDSGSKFVDIVAYGLRFGFREGADPTISCMAGITGSTHTPEGFAVVAV